MTTLVKICGVRQPELALVAADAGADLIGLNFYRPSSRYVAPAEAAVIVRAMRQAGHQTLVVGLFVNESPEAIGAIAESVGLDLIQLSGDEQPDVAARLPRPVLRSLRLGENLGVVAARQRITAGIVMLQGCAHGPLGQALTPLIDADVPGAWGGTGTRADWEQAATLSRLYPLFLAGGLTPENVGAAIRAVEPLGVDVSSGVETNGQKDPAKIRAFVQAVRTADAGARTMNVAPASTDQVIMEQEEPTSRSTWRPWR